MYDIKGIYEAYTIEEAIKLRKENPDAEIIAGGSDVLVKIREGKMAGLELLSINLVDELRGFELLDDNTLRIGALNSFTTITNNELVQKYVPTLGEAVDTAGGPQLRNIATIGGNVCNGAPSADSAPTLFAYNALIEVQGEEGVREVPVQDFYVGIGEVDLKPTELMTAVKITEENYKGYVGHYFKYAMREAMDIATSTCSITAKLNDDLVVEDVRAAYGVAGPVPIRAYDAEEFLKGKELTDENINEFAKLALKELSPRHSWRASKELRTQVLYEIATRCLKECRRKHKGGQYA